MKTILAIAGAALIGAPAFADLLVDTTTGAGGVNFIGSLGNLDDGFVVRPLGNTYTFYGIGYSSMAMEANGNITPTGSGSFGDVAFPAAAPPRIAPQWDDLHMGRNAGATFEDISTSAYYAVTWRMAGLFSGTGNFIFQALLVHDASTICGFSFLAGDIAFSYGAYSTTSVDSLTVGLNQGNGTGASVLPGTTNGRVAYGSTYNTLVPSGANFVLFRVDPTGAGYVASIERCPVPEPASILAIGAGLAALVARRRRK